MQCPNCGHEQQNTRLCAGCGIDFEKYRLLQGALAAEQVETVAEAELPPQHAPRRPGLWWAAAGVVLVGFAVGASRVWDYTQGRMQVPRARSAVQLYQSAIALPLRQRYALTQSWPVANWQLGLPPPESNHWPGFDQVAVTNDGRTVFTFSRGAYLSTPPFTLVIWAAPPSWAPRCGGYGLGAAAQRSLADFCTWDASLSNHVPPQAPEPAPEVKTESAPDPVELQAYAARFDTKMSALMTAADHADEAEVRRLLTSGAEVNALDRYGNSALMYAARAPSPGAVTALLDAGADISLKNQHGAGVWQWALTRKVAPPSDADEAKRQARVQVLGILLARGAKVDLNAIDADGRTLLHHAADEGDALMIQFLAAHGAALELRDADGRTPLMRAALLPGSDDALLALVAAGARASARDGSNHNALELLQLQQPRSPEYDRRYAILLDAMKHPRPPH